jgi:hypothetical protein
VTPTAAANLRSIDSLSEHKGQAMHYKEIASAAKSRGYQSTRPGTPETINRSFWATLKRTPLLFRSVGGGRYRLQEKADKE